MLLRFRIQGSAPDPYQIEFEHALGQLTARCTCPAGEARQACKHRIRLLAGDLSGMVDGTAEDVQLLRSLLPRTRLQDAIEAMALAESDMAVAKKRVSAAKHMLSRVMHE